jgi:hypothetical protein
LITAVDSDARDLINKLFEKAEAGEPELSWCKIDKKGGIIRLSRKVSAGGREYANAMAEKLNETANAEDLKYKNLRIAIATEEAFREIEQRSDTGLHVEGADFSKAD